jgi:hypothetical protein
MQLSFLPAELYLNKTREGEYVVTLQGDEILRTRVEKKALTKFNEFRRKLEAEFPPHELTTEQKRETLKNLIGELKFTEVRNSMKKPKQDRIAKTRTFG